jgi:uncharacterized C2H2 Zn-finger protein
LALRHLLSASDEATSCSSGTKETKVKMQAWIIERRIKLLTDPSMVYDADLKEWLGELESDGGTIVIEDELVISKAAVEFQEIKGKRARKPIAEEKTHGLPAPKAKRLTAGSVDPRTIDCPDCDRRFANAHALAVHIGRTHKDPTKVDPIGPRPARNGSARDQRETDRAEKPHKCPQCGKGFMNAQGLGSHIARSHRETATAAPKISPIPLSRDGGKMVTLDKICTSCFKRFITTSKSKVLCDACFFKADA